MSELAAVQRKHPFVLDRDTGGVVSLEQFLGEADYGTVVGELRSKLAIDCLDGHPRYVCPIPECGDPMTLKSIRVQDKTPHRFYFKHRHRENDCTGTHHLPARAIDAHKFNGAKESLQHLKFKRLIVESIAADQSFTECLTETHWVDGDGVRWRQPDVQARRGRQRIAFEVQLSTTFLHVIAERMKFYRDNNGALLWLFRNLDFSRYRMAEDDILYTNNRNAFCVTEETAAASKEQRRFALDCMWMQPIIRAEGIHEEQCTKRVYFDQLTFDVGKNGAPRAYYFDCEHAREHAERVRPTLPIVQRFERFWLKSGYDSKEWAIVRDQLRRLGAWVPEYRIEDPFYQLINTLYSVKHGRMIGYNYKSRPFAVLGHHLVDRRRPFLRVFHHALDVFGRIEQVKQDDHNHSLELKAKGENGWGGYLERIKQGDPAYDLPEELRATVTLLFPELSPKYIR